MKRLRIIQRENESSELSRYRNDPVGYGIQILKIKPTEDQIQIANAFLEPPYKVKVSAGHNVGKTFLFAWLTNWWYDTRSPGVIITTAPTQRDVQDLLWTEIRLQRHRVNLSNDFIGPVAPEMRKSPEHWAKGYTAVKGESFQGRHRANMLFLFDEDEGIDKLYYDRTKMMFKSGDGHAWGSIGNPYTTSSASYLEENLYDFDGNPAWKLFSLSCLNHPNILAELEGKEPPIPNAVSLAQIKAKLAEECQFLGNSPRKSTDFEFPKQSGKWYRPGPLFEAGVLGRRPTQGTNAVWTEEAFRLACIPSDADPENLIRQGIYPEIGCDVAVFGDDWTAIHQRCGNVSIAHDSYNGLKPNQVADKIKEMCHAIASWCNQIMGDNVRPMSPMQVLVKIELDGYGEGVLSHGENWNWVGVSAASTPLNDTYPNKRSELWFSTSDRAASARVDFTRLPKIVVNRIKQQALAPTYRLDAAGRKVVERKDETKKRLGRSPDDMDAVNQAYYEFNNDDYTEWVSVSRKNKVGTYQ
jgi:hypothetical protein